MVGFIVDGHMINYNFRYATLKSCNNSEIEHVFCQWFPVLHYCRYCNWCFIIKDSIMAQELIFYNVVFFGADNY